MKKVYRICSVVILLLLIGCAGSSFKKKQKRITQTTLGPEYLYRGKAGFSGSFSAEAKGRNFILYLLKSYSPTGFQIVDRMSHLPASCRYKGRFVSSVPKLNFMVWRRGSGKKAAADSINTIVHEANHMLAAYFSYHVIKEQAINPYTVFPTSYKNGVRTVRYQVPYAYYIGGQKFMLVKRTKTFPSNKIKKYFPEQFKQSSRLSFRYRTYVYPSQSQQSTQLDGIYGLLDEFNCYYHGTKAAYDIWPFYRDRAQRISSVLKYFQNFYGTAFAYGEFKLFILLYLHAAKRDYPGIYRQIVANRAFVKTFLLVDANFSKLLRDFEELKKNIYGWLRQQGYTVDDRGRSLFIKKSSSEYGFSFGGARGIGTMVDIQQAYQKELQKPLYRKMMNVLRNVP